MLLEIVKFRFKVVQQILVFRTRHVFTVHGNCIFESAILRGLFGFAPVGWFPVGFTRLNVWMQRIDFIKHLLLICGVYFSILYTDTGKVALVWCGFKGQFLVFNCLF